MDSSVYFIYHDPSDLGSLILIRIIPKERTLSLAIGRIHPIVKDREATEKLSAGIAISLGWPVVTGPKKENNMGDNFAVCLVNFSQIFDILWT